LLLGRWWVLLLWWSIRLLLRRLVRSWLWFIALVSWLLVIGRNIRIILSIITSIVITLVDMGFRSLHWWWRLQWLHIVLGGLAVGTRLCRIIILVGLGGQAKLGSQRGSCHRVGEPVVLAEVQVFQRHVGIIHTNCQLSTSQQPLLSNVVVNLVLGGSQEIRDIITIQIIRIHRLLTVVDKVVIDLIASIVFMSAEASKTKSFHWRIVSLVR